MGLVHFLPVGLDKLHLIGPTNKCLFFGKKSLSVPPLLFPLCLPPLSSAVLPAVPDKSLPRPPLFIPLYLLHPGPTCDCSPSSHLLKFPCQPFFFLPPIHRLSSLSRPLPLSYASPLSFLGPTTVTVMASSGAVNRPMSMCCCCTFAVVTSPYGCGH